MASKTASKVTRSQTVAINPGSVGANESLIVDVAIAGAEPAHNFLIRPKEALTAGLVVQGAPYCLVAGTVHVIFTNHTAAPINNDEADFELVIF